MTPWPEQDAKARFGELLNLCLSEGPQVVTRRGTEAAVLVPFGDWTRLQAAARPTLKALLLAREPQAELDIPARGGMSLRPQIDLE